MTTKYLPMPPNNIGGFIYASTPTKLTLMTILPPHEVAVPLELSKDTARAAISDYFCKQCSFWATADDNNKIKGLTPMEVAQYYKDNNKCPGSKRFATKGCLAGYNKESDTFLISQAKFTTPYIGLETTYNFKGTSNFSLTAPSHRWFSFLDEKLSHLVVYNNFNVFGDGRTCWGDRKVPKDPAEAYNEFFNSLTSSDLTATHGRSLKWAIENWVPNLDQAVTTLYKYDPSDIVAKTLVTKEHPLTGVLLSNNDNWLETVSEKEISILPSGNQIFIGWVRVTSTGVSVICGKSRVYLIDNLNSKTKKPIILGRRKEFNF